LFKAILSVALSLTPLLPDGRIFGKITQEAPKNCPWPGKIGGRKMAEFGKKWQKRGWKLFLQ
jgi:hypothetical protein